VTPRKLRTIAVKWSCRRAVMERWGRFIDGAEVVKLDARRRA
jgi:hypothetical protein